MTAAHRPGPLLAIDTATRTAVVALGDPDGRLLREERWSSAHRHGSELLTRLDALLGTSRISLRDVGGIVVGVGPGSFTGLRVALATAKVIAHSVGLPLVGVSSLEALAACALASNGRVVVLLPAGTADRYVASVLRGPDGLPALDGEPRLLPGTAAARDLAGDARIVAVDLDDDELPPGAAEAGGAAAECLSAGLLALGARAIRDGSTVDPAELVPAYVALPRGVTDAAGGMAWSPDLR